MRHVVCLSLAALLVLGSARADADAPNIDIDEGAIGVAILKAVGISIATLGTCAGNGIVAGYNIRNIKRGGRPSGKRLRLGYTSAILGFGAAALSLTVGIKYDIPIASAMGAVTGGMATFGLVTTRWAHTLPPGDSPPSLNPWARAMHVAPLVAAGQVGLSYAAEF